MMMLSFGTRLNATSWTAALRDLSPRLDHGWWRANGLAGQTVIVNLREVGFADFVTLGHLLIFLRAVTTAGARYSVLQPEPGSIHGESQDDPDAAIRRIRRQNCQLYLDQAGFTDALRDLPDPVDRGKLSLQEVNELKAEAAAKSANSDDENSQLLPNRRRKVLPYRWIAAEQARGMTQSARLKPFEAALRDLGISSEDSAALAKGVLGELLENGAEHSGAPVVLVGGVIVHHETYSERVDDFDESLSSLVRWAAGIPSPLVRLVVADAGNGLLVEPQRVSNAPGSKASRQNILDLLDRRSTSGVHSDSEGIARGLWKVSRIIRGYCGGLLISTAGHKAARVFANSPGGTDVGDSSPIPLPGTIIEGVVLSAPDSDASLGPDEVATPELTQADTRPGVRCITAILTIGKGLETEDLERIGTELANMPTEANGVVITVNVPDGGDAPDDTDIRKSVRQVLTMASGLETPANVTLAFPSINRPLMAVAIEDLNAEQEAQPIGVPSEMGHPLLVLGPENRHFWTGGTRQMRQVLQTLSASGRPGHVDHVVTAADDVLGSARAIREIRENTKLIHGQGELLNLRLRPQDATRAMAGYVGEEIKRSIIEVGGRGVWEGIFLTPNLRLTSHWFDLTELLADLHLDGLAGFALASRVEDRLGRFDRKASPPLILRVGDAPHETVVAFARSLNGHDEYFDSLDDMRVERTDPATGLPRRVLLVTDVASSCRTLIRSLVEVVDREMVPIGVAAIVDSRDPRTVTETDDVSFYERRVPLVRLASIDLEIRDETVDAGQARTIDPVMRRPEIHALSAAHPLVSQDKYISALEGNGAARLGHIERPANRHYTAYVDPTRLFQDADWRYLVLGKLTNKIHQSHMAVLAAEAGQAATYILYPDDSADHLWMVAQGLAQSLLDKGLAVADVVAVPRAAHGNSWRLPASLPLNDDARHIIIVDSAANSGETIRQLIRLAAVNKVAAITSVLLLNGLNDSEALSLQQTAAVHRSGPMGVQRSTSVPLFVHYVARTAVSSLDARDCAICRLRRTYRTMKLLVPMPNKLNDHRDWLMQTLEPRSKQAAFQEQATDLFGANVSQADCVAYLLWRFELREASLRTGRRYQVAQKLSGAAADPVVRDALVRLLVAESHWLRSAPLWFQDCRSQLADLAASLLAGSSAQTIDQMLRVQAVILLANAAPERFASQLSAILDANRHQEPVVLQVLLEALRLIAGPTGQTPFARDLVTQPLVLELVRIETKLRDTTRSRRANESVQIDVVRYVLSHARRQLHAIPTDPQTAWAALRDHEQSVANHYYFNAIWRVLLSVGLIGRGDPPADLDSVRDDWARCSNFLLLDILPSVHLLRGPMIRAKIMQNMRADDHGRWEQVINGDGAGLIDHISLRLDALLNQVGLDQQAATYSVDGLLTDLEWWDRFFLGAPDGGTVISAVVGHCPADLFEVLRDAFQGTAHEIEFPDSQDPRPERLWIFCSKRTLRDVFTHIRINAEDTHRMPGTELRFHVAVTRRDDGTVDVVVRNMGSSALENSGGHGLRALRHELSVFGSDLASLAVESPWSYGICVSLDPWRMPI